MNLKFESWWNKQPMSKVPSSLITEAFKGISFSAWNGALSPDLFKALEDLLKHAEANYCTHENELYRGGQIWTICRDCGKQWADDRGGVPKDVHEYPEVIKNARKVLEAVKVKK